jgi:FKBP-type peptidyl-prolyl cis-trans isomerase SlyD
MSKPCVAPGKYVSITYSILDDADQVLEQNDLPMGFVYGSDTQLLGGMDRLILGHGAGEVLVGEVPPDQGFGAHDPDLCFTDDLDNVPPEFRRIGAEVEMQNEAGESRSFTVTRIEEGRLTVDGNHPMAGKHLRVRVRIEEVRDALPGEAQATGIHAARPGAGGIH